jgi:hypothetical protein
MGLLATTIGAWIASAGSHIEVNTNSGMKYAFTKSLGIP